MQFPNSVRLNSILDNDFYKFTMQAATIKLFPNAKARYKFINRGNHQYPKGFAKALREAIDDMATLQLTKEEKTFLKIQCPYLSPAYIDFLEGYRYDPTEVTIQQHEHDVEVTIEGNWYRTILWEVPIMSLIAELYYELTDTQRWTDEEIIKNTLSKVKALNEMGVNYADFGTRRRHSYHVHRLVVRTLAQHDDTFFRGSSNVHMAMVNQVKPIGTHAHEWFMFHGARYGFKMANSLALDHWVDVYRGDLGIALSDTYTTDVFFKQFDKKLSKLFDGVRHDSGDAVEFAEKTINHYKQLGINPLYKQIIFSDGLTIDKVKRITEATKGKIGISFGIGTSLTNDVGLERMNFVIKLTEVNYDEDWIPVIKLSDEKGKHTGSKEMIQLAKELLLLN